MPSPEVPLGGVATELPPETPTPDTPSPGEPPEPVRIPDDLRGLLDEQAGQDALDITAPADRGQTSTHTAEAHREGQHPDETDGRAIGRVSMSDVDVPATDEPDPLGDREVPPPIEPPDKPPVPSGESGDGDGDGGDRGDDGDPRAAQRAAEADLALYGPIQLSTGEIVGRDVGVVRTGGGEAVATPRHEDFHPPETEAANAVIFEELSGEAQQPPQSEEAMTELAGATGAEQDEQTTPAEPEADNRPEAAEPAADMEELPPEEIERLRAADSVRYWVGKVTQQTARMVDAAAAGAPDETVDRIRLARKAAEVQLRRAITGELAPRFMHHSPQVLRRVIQGIDDINGQEEP